MSKSKNEKRSHKAVGSYGAMRGTISELGDIVTPMEHEPAHAELGIAYIGEHGPVYYTGNGAETTNDV